MTPAQKRLRTVKKRYGSVSNMLKKRDVRDLILGGYNGGIQRVEKGFATWDKEKLKAHTAKRVRNSKGQFAREEVRDEVSKGDTDRQGDVHS